MQFETGPAALNGGACLLPSGFYSGFEVHRIHLIENSAQGWAFGISCLDVYLAERLDALRRFSIMILRCLAERFAEKIGRWSIAIDGFRLPTLHELSRLVPHGLRQ